MSRLVALGVVQFAIAAFLGVISAWLIYVTWTQWSGGWHLQAAATAARAGNLAGQTREVQAAARLLPDEAVAILPDIDLMAPEGRARLVALHARCPAAQQALVELAICLSDTLRGQAPGAVPAEDAADATLLTELARLRSGAPGTPIATLRELGAPHQSVLAAWAVADWRAAFAAQDWPRASLSAGLVTTLLPDHPDAPLVRLAALALAPDFDPDRLLHSVVAGVDRTRLLPFAEHLARVEPGRTREIMTTVLNLTPSMTTAQRLSDEVAAVGDQGLSAAWVQQDCLANGEVGLAKSLIERMPESDRGLVQTELRNRVGDLAELCIYAAAEPACRPRISVPIVDGQLISFQLSNDYGMLPRSNLVMTIDGAPVAPSAILRLGPVIGIRTTLHGPHVLTVRGGEHAIYSATVDL